MKAKNGFWLQFVEKKLAPHAEPPWGPRPKGTEIPYSRQKLHAALLGLTNLRGHEQARQCGVAHGLLRKWHTEPRFQTTVDELAREFAEALALQAESNKPRWNRFIRKGLQNPNLIERIARQGLRIDFQGLEDAPLYGPRLVAAIQERTMQEIPKLLKGPGNAFSFDTLCRILAEITRRQGRKPTAKWRKELLRADGVRLLATLEAAKKCMERGESPEVFVAGAMLMANDLVERLAATEV